MSLYGDFLVDDHRRAGKWLHYFPIYERHFARFKNRYATLFEIGVAGGGSLQLWRRYFGPLVRIVGVDIDPECKRCEEDQIAVRIGDQSDPAFLASLIKEFGPPDIVIDDGSHIQSHINATFDVLYPTIPKNGVYLVEDLHTAYWDDFEGGLERAGTFIERTKAFIDELHAHHSRGAMKPTGFGKHTDSIHCYDSVIVFEVGEERPHMDRWIGTAR
ncbi:MAG: hypothetical protein KGK10_01585 [Rhodospirillales bacterium]|nr:hypothetical protein [Rhodospirillales bacterium]